MIKLIILISLNCPSPEVVNKTTIWNEDDIWNLERAKIRCGEIYTDAPCLKLFVKKGKLLYQAICGEHGRD